MYIIVDNNNNIVWVNKAPLEQKLKPLEVWHKFNYREHRMITVDHLPKKPYIIDGDIIRTMTTQEKIDNNIIELKEDQIVEDDKIRDMTDKEKVTAGLMTQAEYEEDLWLQIRGQRNSLLLQSDWTQLADVPKIDKQVWIIYRQALRDVPQNNSDPENITWPERPEDAK